MHPVPFALALFLLPGSVSAAPLPAQLEDPKTPEVKITGHIVRPKPKSIPTSQLDVPPGFDVQVFAENLVNPRMLAVHDSGTVYVTRRKLGDVLILRDTDGDGRADERRVVANRPNAHGIAIDGDTL